MQNLILRSLPPQALAALQPLLEPVDFATGNTLEFPAAPDPFAHFIESGFVSVLLRIGPDVAEIGLVGPEGVLGIPALLGSKVAAYQAVVRHGGRAVRARADRLRELSRVHPVIGDQILRFVQAEFVQVAHTSFANARLTVIERLARWVLMAHDRIQGDVLKITHDVLAGALDVRRPGVTTAIHELEGDGAVRSKRNTLTILDRERLKKVAGPAYGPAESAYQILIGHPLSAVARAASVPA